MAELENAARRLERALDRLERAIDARTPGADTKLRAELEAARKQNAELKTLTETVAGRLDATIARLKSTLEA